MKRLKHYIFKFFISGIFLLLSNVSVNAQCNNADFENCSFAGWTGTNCKSTLDSTAVTCDPFDVTCLLGSFTYTGTNFPDPFKNSGLDIGTINQAADATPENSHFIMQSGSDPVAGADIPVVFPGGGVCSARLGNAQAQGGGETMMYKYTVTPTSNSFTYNYAVVLRAGNHQEGQQPYFRIRMWVYDNVTGDSTAIDCATYDVDANTAPNIGGFTVNGDLMWKPWSAVTVPLKIYEGQTVSIQFTTRDCCPDCDANGVGTNGGSHWAYAYVDASCEPLEIIPSVPAVCAGQNMNLTAPAGSAFSWSGPGIVSGTNEQVVTVNQPGTYSVTVTPFSNNPCDYVLTVDMPENLAGGANVSVNSANACLGGSATLTASGGETYSWAPGGETSESITVSPTSTTTYTVTGSSGSCGSGTAEATVTIVPPPTSPFTVIDVCAGEASTITYTGNAGPTDTYDWNFDGGTVLSGSGQGPYSVSWPTSGTYNVSLTVSVGSCVSTPTTMPVTVNPSPTITITPSTVCAGNSGTITATGADTYLWSNGITTAALTDSPTGTTNYTVTGTSAGCSSTEVGTITVNQSPALTINDPVICEGNTAIITAGGADSYLWNDGSTSNSISVSPATTTTYSVTGTNAGGCSSDTTSTVTITLQPVITVNNPSICAGQTATLTASGGATYEWETGQTGPSITVSPTTTTTYTVGDNTPGCSGSTTATVTITPPPTVLVSDANICEGNTATLTAGGADSYVWSNGESTNPIQVSPTTTTSYTVTGYTASGCSGTAVSTVNITLKPIITVNSPSICLGQSATLTASGGATYDWETGETGNSIAVSPTTTTTYTVGDNTPGCSGASTATVTVNMPPVVTVNPITICEGETATLSAAGANAYSWSNGATLSSTSVSPTTTTTYTVIGTSAAGCSDTTTVEVTVNPLPVVTVDSTEVCAGETSTLTANGAINYAWSNGATGSTITNSPNSTTTYVVTGTDANGCSAQAVGEISIIPLPKADFDANPNPTVVSTPIVNFFDQSSNDVNYWFWNFGDGDSLLPDTKNPTHTYPKVETTYEVTLIVRNDLCENSVTHPIVVGPEYSFFIPNAFSPNGDGENDTFNGKGQGILEYNLSIFDRWGNFIFYTESLDEGWDGTANAGNDVAQQDVYIWKVELKDIFFKTHSFIGTVTLVRGD